MTQAPKKEQDIMEVAPAQEGDGKDNKEIQKFSKLTPYLTTVPRSVTKFEKLAAEKRPASSIPLKISDPKYIASLEGPFGFGPLVFPAFQRFNNIDFFLFIYCLTVMVHGALFSLSDMSLKQMVKKFSLTEKEITIMDLTYYYTSILVAIVATYYGGRGNRSKWLAAYAFILGISSIVFAVPFYKYEIIKPLEESEELCTEKLVKTDCGRMTLPHRSICIYLFIIAQCLHGMAGIPIYILGLTFIFDHVPTFSAGLYLAIADGALILGYFLGIAIGAQGSKHLQNQTLNGNTNEYSFRQWQKSWWSSYFAFAVFLWFTLLPLLCFPRWLPGAHKLMLEKEKEPHSFDKRLKDKEFGSGLKDLLQVAKCLVCNPLLLCCSLYKAMESVTFKGTSQFVPIYLENQFLLTPSAATKLTGMMLFPGGAISHFLGGIIVDRLEMSCKNKLRFTAVTSFIGFMLFILILSVNCQTVKFAGINTDYDGTGILGNLTAPCNEKCDCTSTLYASVCGRDDIEYFSACYAGCRHGKYLHNEKTFYNCSCIKEGLTSSDSEGHFIDASSGKCNANCHTLPLFFAFYFSSIIFSNLPSIPIIICILQVVPTHLNSLGMGVTFTIWRFIASVPIPPIFKKTSTEACIYWSINKCGFRGRCWIYDKSKMTYMLMGLCLGFKLSAVLISLLTVFIFDRVVKGSTDSLVEISN
ncbi:solute carrier organic anion transporter family member 6C1-like [Chionomys nivalis]|uniref:solute carrier organic anion transporter family member 6C1-like n=1 Tax=Chionomys nivalis TaxID=269649 RepID=UPI00259A0F53|nr:solute carrier organic anion transporter family member 6C1-like [Chionomys nivalis]